MCLGTNSVQRYANITIVSGDCLFVEWTLGMGRAQLDTQRTKIDWISGWTNKWGNNTLRQLYAVASWPQVKWTTSHNEILLLGGGHIWRLRITSKPTIWVGHPMQIHECLFCTHVRPYSKLISYWWGPLSPKKCTRLTGCTSSVYLWGPLKPRAIERTIPGSRRCIEYRKEKGFMRKEETRERERERWRCWFWFCSLSVRNKVIMTEKY